MLGTREPDLYGKQNYHDLEHYIHQEAKKLDLDAEIHQFNEEGEMVEEIQKAVDKDFFAVIINAGAWTHYSYAIADALRILTIPIYEVHLTDIEQREEFRKFSVIKDIAQEQIKGLGFGSYLLALERIAEIDLWPNKPNN